MEEEIDWKTKYLYLLAEFDNYKKNRVKQESDRLKYNNEDILVDLLPVLDNIDKAEDASDGVKLIFRQFQNILQNYGLSIMEVNDRFDENIHNAVATTTIPNAEDNKIVEIWKNGYLYKDKIIRYPDVIVNKHQDI